MSECGGPTASSLHRLRAVWAMSIDTATGGNLSRSTPLARNATVTAAVSISRTRSRRKHAARVRIVLRWLASAMNSVLRLVSRSRCSSPTESATDRRRSVRTHQSRETSAPASEHLLDEQIVHGGGRVVDQCLLDARCAATRREGGGRVASLSRMPSFAVASMSREDWHLYPGDLVRCVRSLTQSCMRQKRSRARRERIGHGEL